MANTNRRASGALHLDRAGLTLVELMVTLVISFVIVAAIYMIYTQSVTGYRIQSQVVQMQGQLRFGIEHMRRDIELAGFQATSNSRTDPYVCWVPPTVNLYAISVARDLDIDEEVANVDLNTQIEPSAVTLFGDFWSPAGQVFETLSISDSGVVLLDKAQLDATFDTNADGIDDGGFAAAFRPGARFLRVTNQEEKIWFARIIGASFADATLQLQSVPAIGACRIGIGTTQVNPVGWVRYRLAEDTRTAALLGNAGDIRTAGKVDLVREEVDVTGTAIANTRLTIAEYAVDLQFYDFGFDTALAGNPVTLAVENFVDDVVELDDTGQLGAGDATDFATPEQLRFVTVKLSVRTTDEDESVPFVPRQDSIYEPLRTYEVFPELTGAARVESLAKRVDLRNNWFARR
jgi:hypothetical protein